MTTHVENRFPAFFALTVSGASEFLHIPAAEKFSSRYLVKVIEIMYGCTPNVWHVFFMLVLNT